ncbi:hypothetical protein, partial [Mameliella alba]|uniref:hypothetical protein n=1 Tax=Mameliella alba TaxID=561184 RepID=UPI001B88039B
GAGQSHKVVIIGVARKLVRNANVLSQANGPWTSGAQPLTARDHDPDGNQAVFALTGKMALADRKNQIVASQGCARRQNGLPPMALTFIPLAA